MSENEIFVIGDNRSYGISFNSGHFGSIPTEKIIGKIIFRIFPFSKTSNF